MLSAAASYWHWKLFPKNALKRSKAQFAWARWEIAIPVKYVWSRLRACLCVWLIGWYDTLPSIYYSAWVSVTYAYCMYNVYTYMRWWIDQSTRTQIFNFIKFLWNWIMWARNCMVQCFGFSINKFRQMHESNFGCLAKLCFWVFAYV